MYTWNFKINALQSTEHIYMGKGHFNWFNLLKQYQEMLFQVSVENSCKKCTENIQGLEKSFFTIYQKTYKESLELRKTSGN